MIGLQRVVRKKAGAACIGAFKDIAGERGGKSVRSRVQRLVIGGGPPIKGFGKAPDLAADREIADANFAQGVIEALEENLLQRDRQSVARRRVLPEAAQGEENMEPQDLKPAFDGVRRAGDGVEGRGPRRFVQRLKTGFRLALRLIFSKPAGGHGRVPSPGRAGSSMPAPEQGCRMKFGRVLASLAVLASLQGCISFRSAHGYVLERGETELSAKAGVDTKESVLAKYGEPSMIGTFDRNRWYYLYSLDATRAFFKPKTTARTVVEFQFNEDGKVAAVNEIGLGDSVDVKMASRETPTRGKELGFWEQLLGNVGQLPAGGLGQQQGPPR